MNMRAKKITIAFVITGLGLGGAEMMLLKLLSRMNRERFTPVVISLAGSCALDSQVQAMGIELIHLQMRSGRMMFVPILRLGKLLRKLRPDIVQGWMYHGNVAASIATWLAPNGASLMWNIRGTMTDLSREPLLTALIIWLGARLSRFPAVVINNSRASAEQHRQQLGYAYDNVRIIPNGFDTDKFRPDEELRKSVRLQWGLRDDDFVIGHIGRLHPMKDHELMVRALGELAQREIRPTMVWVGEDKERRLEKLMDLAELHGVARQIKYFGSSSEVASLLCGFDLFTLPSAYGEGFPNVVGEAMAAGLPCVVTPVGDSAHLVADTGFVVPVGDATSLAKVWQSVMNMSAAQRASYGFRARQRIIDLYSLSCIVSHYENLYRDALMDCSSCAQTSKVA